MEPLNTARMHDMNRLATAVNPYQGPFKKVLFVCSAGILRSPTAAHLFSSPPWNMNTRACGAEPSFALIPISEALVHWADEIVCMTQAHRTAIDEFIMRHPEKKAHVWNIPDDYAYRDERLVEILEDKGNETWCA